MRGVAGRASCTEPHVWATFIVWIISSWKSTEPFASPAYCASRASTLFASVVRSL